MRAVYPSRYTASRTEGRGKQGMGTAPPSVGDEPDTSAPGQGPAGSEPLGLRIRGS